MKVSIPAGSGCCHNLISRTNCHVFYNTTDCLLTWPCVACSMASPTIECSRALLFSASLPPYRWGIMVREM